MQRSHLGVVEIKKIDFAAESCSVSFMIHNEEALTRFHKQPSITSVDWEISIPSQVWENWPDSFGARMCSQDLPSIHHDGFDLLTIWRVPRARHSNELLHENLQAHYANAYLVSEEPFKGGVSLTNGLQPRHRNAAIPDCLGRFHPAVVRIDEAMRLERLPRRS